MKRRHFIPFPIVFLGLPVLIVLVGAIPWVIGWNEAKRVDYETVESRLELPPGTSLSDLKSAKVLEVIDGDTIDVVVDGIYARIRYFGVDTPERGAACYREAVDRNDTLVGETVLLLPDARERDDGGRLLRYAFTPEGISIDATLVAEGYAEAWRRDGRYRDQIVALQQQAEAADRGCLWKEDS